MKTLQNRIHGEQVLDHVNHITESETIGINDSINLVSDADGAVVVTLPPVAQAKGRTFEIRTIVDSGSNGVDVVAGGDARYNTTEVDPSAGTTIDVSSAVAIDTAGDFLLMYSTGLSWVVLAHYIQ